MPTVDPAAPKQPLALPDRTLVAATIETRVPVRGQFKALTPLAGDASNRRYFRIELTGGAAHSVILMQLAEPEAVDALVHMQSTATSPADQHCLAFHRRFDVPLLMWEFEHFLEYGIVARQGKPMCTDDHLPIRSEFEKIAELLAGQPRVFVHRD